MFENVQYQGTTLAVILRKDFRSTGINFFTPDDFSQQLAYMSHPEGHVIEAHVHNEVSRNVKFTLEVIFIKSGKVRVDLYLENRDYFQSRILSEGDLVLLASGGHGFQMLEPSELIEVKQGPYAGEADKIRFPGVSQSNLVFGG